MSNSLSLSAFLLLIYYNYLLFSVRMTLFVDSICQRISPKVRLRPTNECVRALWDGDFSTFCNLRDVPRPSLETFRRASKHVWFSDISKRTRHNHVRCSTCAEFAALKSKAFREGRSIASVMAKVIIIHSICTLCFYVAISSYVV